MAFSTNDERRDSLAPQQACVYEFNVQAPWSPTAPHPLKRSKTIRANQGRLVRTLNDLEDDGAMSREAARVEAWSLHLFGDFGAIPLVLRLPRLSNTPVAVIVV